jgi:hypothetical protein
LSFLGLNRFAFRGMNLVRVKLKSILIVDILGSNLQNLLYHAELEGQAYFVSITIPRFMVLVIEI